MDAATGVIIFLFLYLFFILFLAYTIMFGGSARHDSTCVGRVHIFLTETLSQKCQLCLGRFFCQGSDDPEGQAYEAFDKAFTCFERRVMPGIYLVLLAAGLAAAKSQIVPRLAELNPPGELCPKSRFACVPGLPLTLPPTTYPEAVYIYAILSFFSWFQIFIADPGYVTPETFERLKNVYPYDGVIFHEGRTCRTCGHAKLPRSKHDKTIGKCVIRYDHFCGWTGNVIGLYNTNRFLIFLAVHLVMLCHGAMLCVEIVHAKMQFFIAGNYTYTPTNTRITRFSPTIALAAEPTVSLFLFVLLVSVGVVGGFLLYHLFLVASNTTTSETFKWAPIREACVDFKNENFGRSFGDKREEQARKDAKGDPELLELTPEFDSDGFPVNIYDGGIVRNFLEVFFPVYFARQAAARAVERDMRDAERLAAARARLIGESARQRPSGRPKDE